MMNGTYPGHAALIQTDFVDGDYDTMVYGDISEA